jgi:hypothetical protein
MKAFSEKADFVLRTLSTTPFNWETFTQRTGIAQFDPILTLLKNKEFIDYSNEEIRITNEGKEFISVTSFVEQRDKFTLSQRLK